MGYNVGVGREAPQFTLTSHDGNEVSLKQYRGDWFAALVFLEAASPGAADTVGALSNAAAELWGYRAQLVGVVHGAAAEVVAVAAAAPKATFPLLADEDGAVARAYAAWDAGSGVTRGRVVVVDRAGKIVWDADAGATPVKAGDIVAGLRGVAR